MPGCWVRPRAPVSAGPVADSRERGNGSGCHSIREATKGSVDCVHQFRRPLLSSQERPSLQAPLRSRHPTLRHRRLTRTRRARSRYHGQRSRQWSTTRRVVTCRNLGARFATPYRADLGGIWLDLMLTRVASRDQPQGRCSALFERRTQFAKIQERHQQ